MQVKAMLRRAAVKTALALGARSYSAAKGGRLNRDFRPFLTSADEEIVRDLRTLRARSRQLARDDDYFKSFLRKLKVNVIGAEGVTMKLQAQLTVGADATTHGNARNVRDRKLNKQVEDAWFLWSKPENASASRKLSFIDLSNLCIESVAVDGEAIFRHIYGTNAFGYALQQIDPDWLDENFNSTNQATGNRIVMSVELDRFDAPVAYWFTPPRHSYFGVVRDIGLADDAQRKRVPASEIVHVFVSERAGQTRGVPWAHTAMGRIHQLDKYEEAELTNARVSASKMGFVMPDVECLYEGAQDVTVGEEGKPRSIEITDFVEPGMIQQLPAGWKFETFDPKSPTTTFSLFVKSILRGIASGLGIGYNSLASDLEHVNYSSLRTSALEDRDVWRTYQKFLKEHFFEPVYATWLNVVNGSPFLNVPLADFDRVKYPVFRGRGWDWVDPMKDAQANVLEYFAGQRTLTEILAERGVDLEEHLETYKYEQDLLKGYGIVLIQVKQGGTDGQGDQGAGGQGSDKESGGGKQDS